MKNEIWEWPCSASNTKEIHWVGKGLTVAKSCFGPRIDLYMPCD